MSHANTPETKPFKVVFVPSLPTNQAFVYEQYFNRLEEAETALNAIANYTLFLHQHHLMPDDSNAGMVYENINGEWVEIDEEGNEL